MSNELSKDRAESAIEVIETIAEASEQEYRIADASMSTSFDYDLYEKYTEAFETCIAALDAVRWRDAETEPPEANATVLVRWKAENGVQGYNFSYFEDGNWYGNSGYKIIEWLPLPTWE